MFELILVGWTNTWILCTKKAVWARSGSLRSVFKINAPPEIPILSRVKMAAVDSSDTKKSFFSSQLDWGGRRGRCRAMTPWRNLCPTVRHVDVREVASKGGITPHHHQKKERMCCLFQTLQTHPSLLLIENKWYCQYWYNFEVFVLDYCHFIQIFTYCPPHYKRNYCTF